MPRTSRHGREGKSNFENHAMKTAKAFCMVLVTAPDRKTARVLARAALSARLIACANLISRIESHYWWRGKIESGDEVLLILKHNSRSWPRWKN